MSEFLPIPVNFMHLGEKKKKDNSSICWTQWVNALQQFRNIIQI